VADWLRGPRRMRQPGCRLGRRIGALVAEA